MIILLDAQVVKTRILGLGLFVEHSNVLECAQRYGLGAHCVGGIGQWHRLVADGLVIHGRLALQKLRPASGDLEIPRRPGRESRAILWSSVLPFLTCGILFSLVKACISTPTAEL